MEIDLAELARSLESNKQDEVQNATRRRIAITAPADGMVSAYQLSTGQAIQQDQFLFDFLPAQVGTSADKPQVHLFASSRTVGFVKPGQLVNLRFDAFPFQKFGMFKGAVATVSRTPFPTSAIPASAFAPQSQQAEVREPMYRILVDLKAGQANADSVLSQLKPGMSVTADVLLEERAIWEWMFEPLIALRRKL